MKPRPKNLLWRVCRIYFRRFRIAVWLVVLLLLGALLYLNQVGLPGPIKKPLLDQLHARGLDLQFTRLRWRFHQGIVAENVRFGRADDTEGPHLTLAEVQVRVNLRSLSKLRPQVDSVMFRRGRLIWPFANTNDATADLVIDNVQSELRFLSDDRWELDHFRARLAGATIELGGVVTNASAVRDWPFFQGKKATPADARVWESRLQRFAHILGRIHFSDPPELRLDIKGDARDLQSFNVFMAINAPGAETPWGMVSQGRFTARLLPADTNRSSRAQIRLEAASSQTPWASITNFSLGLQLTSAEGNTNLAWCRMALSAQEAETRWASGSNIACSAGWVHSITNPVPLSGDVQIDSELVKTSWAAARQAQVRARLHAQSAPGPTPDPSWAWWTNLQPHALDASFQAREVLCSNLVASAVSFGASWRAPLLTLSNLSATLYGGKISAAGSLDVASRATSVSLESTLDPHPISEILPGDARQWLDQFTWAKPPYLKGEASLILPAWTYGHPNWWTEVKPSVDLRGELRFDDLVTFRGISVTSANSHVTYSNLTLRLQDLALTRPEGRFTATHVASELAGDFYWRIGSSIDPQIIKPLLDTSALEVFDLISFTRPPVLEAEIWGRSHEPDRIGFRGRVAITNFTFRSEAINSVETSLRFTNQVLEFFEPKVQRGAERATADGVTADFNAQFIYLTNGISTADPMFIARVIGTNVVRAIGPYHFSNPPLGHVYGTIPMHGDEGADLHFDLDGGPFHWWKFNLPHIAGHVHWAGLHVMLTNIQADFYGGKIAGAAAFDCPPNEPTDFRFALAMTNAQLKPLVADMFSYTNPPEGQVSCTLTVTRATTESWQTVFGFGDTTLRDGLLWDIPLFGVFSPVLNGIAPGLGSSRATAGACNFIITNGVIRTENLDLRCTGMRLKYHGTVDLESKVNARVEAELLKDMWVVGPIVSTMFWPVTKMFEYKVAGTLGEPKTEPVFIIPKLVLFPFHPLRSLKGMFQDDSNPVFSPLPPER